MYSVVTALLTIYCKLYITTQSQVIVCHCVNCLDLSSLMKDKSELIEKLELALEKQQDGRFKIIGLHGLALHAV